MTLLIVLNLLINSSFSQIAILPNTCDDLLPDLYPYIYFMEETGNLWFHKSRRQAKKIYNLLAIRKLYQEMSKDYINPIDNLIKDSLCECYKRNKKNTFTANSEILRKHLTTNIGELLKRAKAQYASYKIKLNLAKSASKRTIKDKHKIEHLKNKAMKDMSKDLAARGK